MRGLAEGVALGGDFAVVAAAGVLGVVVVAHWGCLIMFSFLLISLWMVGVVIGLV